MKFKNIKILILLLAIFFLLLTAILMRFTYARYITSLTAKSSVEMGSWSILINDQNILENSDVSNAITPIFNSNSEYIAEGKVSPTSTGYIEITINYQEVSVPFKYEVTLENTSNTELEDFKLINYSIDDGNAVSAPDSNLVISGTVYPTETAKTKKLKFNFAWIDDENNALDDIQDTAISRDLNSLKIPFHMSFTQLQPSA